MNLEHLHEDEKVFLRNELHYSSLSASKWANVEIRNHIKAYIYVGVQEGMEQGFPAETGFVTIKLCLFCPLCFLFEDHSHATHL